MLAATPASAAAFATGNVVVLRDGTGAAALSSAATATFLDEYAASGAQTAPVNTVALPTTASGAAHALTDSGSATSDGQITNSGDGQTILVAGYDAPVGTASIAGSSSATYPRVIGRVGVSGIVDSTTSNASNNNNNFRSATSASLKGVETNLSVGGTDGVQATTEGQSVSTTYATPAAANTRVIHVYAGQTFVSGSSTGSVTGVGVVINGVITQLSGVSAANAYGFGLARTGVGPTYVVNGVDTRADTIFVADATNGLVKYVYQGNNAWASAGNPVPGTFYGLAVRAASAGTEIYVTTPSALDRIADAGTTTATASQPGALTTLATAGTNRAFRGVAFTPPTPSTSLPEAPYAVLLPLIGISAVGAVAMRRSALR